jgi:predicted benzoate:H+ symporter BenE
MNNFFSSIFSNIKSAKFNRHEISGAFGDMGTYLPLTAAFIAINGLDAGSVLLFSGLFNLLTGIIYGIPMCVQPMKAIASIALAEKLTKEEILAAGIITSAVIFILGVTGLVTRLSRRIPFSVVRGLQLGIGINLLIKGINLITGTGKFIGYDSISLGVIAAFLVMLLFFSRKIPGALVIFIGGVILTYIARPELLNTIYFEITFPEFSSIPLTAFESALWKAAVPQIPLTLLNSVIAVTALSGDLFPDKKASERSVSITVGLMNSIGCWFGAMPTCHGSGGLAGQYRFGARTAGSMIFLGFLKMSLGTLMAGSITILMLNYPKSILGVLLFFSGMELALLCRDQQTKTQMFIVILTAVTIITLKTFIGFIIGLISAYLIYHGVIKIEEKFEPRRLIKVLEDESK